MWKDVHGWEEYYEVSDKGEVRNKLTNKILTGDTNSTGYHRIALQNINHDPSYKRCFVHRLVAEHFIHNPENLSEVNHIDLNINNNTASNLEWCDKKYNERHSRIYGTSKEYKPFKVVFDDGSEIVYGFKQDLADELQVAKTTVQSWLHQINEGYKHYRIESIGYI